MKRMSWQQVVFYSRSRKDSEGRYMQSRCDDSVIELLFGRGQNTSMECNDTIRAILAQCRRNSITTPLLLILCTSSIHNTEILEQTAHLLYVVIMSFSTS